MLEKRRYGAGLPTTPLVVVLITSTLCLSLWRFSAPPAPPDTRAPAAPTYLLLLPGNATSAPPPYQTGKLPPGDISTLVDLDNFAFTLNSNPCNTTASLLVLVLVHSAPGNVEKRDTIRKTWGRPPPAAPTLTHKVLFLLGAVDTADKQAYIEEEDAVHHDLVQGSFLDSYRNMTYKHVMALKWAAYFCPNARYVLKTDDDVFVNLPTLVDFIAQELSLWGARRLMLCVPFAAAVVKRTYRSKWRVSPAEYPGRVYPTYCAGWAVLYSPDVVFLLYREAQRAAYFWIDDVHVTGTLAARVNVTQTALGSLALTDHQVRALIGDLGRSDNGSTVGAFLFGAPNLPQTSIHRLWRVVLQRRRPSRPQPFTPAA